MNRKLLFALWGGLYALCALFGFVPNPQGAVGVLMILLAIACFVPPLLLIRSGNRDTVRLVRNLSILWLVLTVGLILANFLSITASTLTGNVLYCLLVVISSPMICGQYWVLGLFGWAYLLADSVRILRKR